MQSALISPDGVLSEVRRLLLDDTRLLRAVATLSSKTKAAPAQSSRVELRPVELKGGRALCVERFVGTQSFTANHAFGQHAGAVDAALGEAFDNWRVETRDATVSVTRHKDGGLRLRRGPPVAASPASLAHDKPSRPRLLDAASLAALGVASPDGKVKAAFTAKLKQVESVLSIFDAALADGLACGRIAPATDTHPLRVVDLGCGNALLTFAIAALLRQKGAPFVVTGVDAKPQAAQRNAALSSSLGFGDSLRFVAGTIAESCIYWPATEAPSVVVALHACDTASDDALAASVLWRSPLALVAPCCQHSLNAQLASPAPHLGPAPSHPLLRRSPLLRERLGDVLTDSLRLAALRLLGFRSDAVEFVAGEHTPRNVMLRCVRTGAVPPAAEWEEWDAELENWSVTPYLATSLAGELAAARAAAARR